MADCLLLKKGGGGGVDTSAVTATAPDVIVGKVFANKEGEPIAGAMKDMSKERVKIEAFQNKNNRFEFALPKGYYKGDLAADRLAYLPYAQVAALYGITPDKVKKGYTVCGVVGTYTY